MSSDVPSADVPPDPKDLVLAPPCHHLRPVQLLAAALVVAHELGAAEAYC